MNNNREITPEKEISLIDLGKILWKKRKFILKASLIGFIAGIIIAFSIPKEYTTTVILAPESASSGVSGNMGALVAMTGLNLGGSSGDGQMSPDLYPNIAESTPFILGLFDVKVNDAKKGVDTTLYSYIKDDQKIPWWSKVLGLSPAMIGLFSDEASGETPAVINPFELTSEQTRIFNNLRNRIIITVDKKSGTITLTSTMQSPIISATIADTLTSYLQSYIINYRTEKARQDLAFTENLYAEAKKDYSDAQKKYASYIDANQNVILAAFRVNQEKLQNEVALTYGVYNQMAQQLQMAKVKVQDITPVYTVIQPAIVPLIPASPNKKMIVIAFVILAGVISSGFILAKEIWADLNNK